MASSVSAKCSSAAVAALSASPLEDGRDQLRNARRSPVADLPGVRLRLEAEAHTTRSCREMRPGKGCGWPWRSPCGAPGRRRVRPRDRRRPRRSLVGRHDRGGVFLAATQGGRAGDERLDQAAQVEEILERSPVGEEDPTHDLRGVGSPSADHERAAAASAGDAHVSRGRQSLQRFADARLVDREQCGEFALREGAAGRSRTRRARSP